MTRGQATVAAYRLHIDRRPERSWNAILNHRRPGQTSAAEQVGGAGDAFAKVLDYMPDAPLDQSEERGQQDLDVKAVQTRNKSLNLDVMKCRRPYSAEKKGASGRRKQ